MHYMKNMLRKVIGAVTLLAIIAATASGCVEHRYYHEHHYHTRGWYDGRHQSYPAGVNFEIHN
jgi:hypothetical protein